MIEISIPSLDGIAGAAREFVAQIGTNRVFAFYGNMGAGKTTFIKALCEAMGTEDIVNSPTFAIVNVYEVNGKDNTINLVFESQPRMHNYTVKYCNDIGNYHNCLICQMLEGKEEYK